MIKLSYAILASSCLISHAIATLPQRIEFRHIEAEGIGYNQGYSTAEGFFAFLKPTLEVPKGFWIPILDLRGHIFNNGHPAANAGIALRYAAERVWGINAYYDYRSTPHSHYQQGSFGLESLGRKLDFRAQGYFPFGKTESSFFGLKFDSFQGHWMFLARKKELALTGGNAEIGFHAIEGQISSLYAAAGPYFFAGHGKRAWGGEGRVAWTLGKYIRIEANGSYDSLFRTIFQGQVALTIPFGSKTEKKETRNPSAENWIRRERALQRIERNEIIAVDKKQYTNIAIDPSTGDPLFFWFVDNTSNSEGTFESPFPTLAAAESASEVNDIIYVFPGDETDQGLDIGFVLQDRQRMLGSGISHRFSTTLGSVQTPPLSSTAPHVSNRNQPGLLGNAIDVAHQNEVSGFSITNIKTPNSSSGIGSLLNSVSNCTITHNTFFTTRNGVFLVPAIDEQGGTLGTIFIDHNEFIGVDHTLDIRGIIIAWRNGHIEISNNLFTGPVPQGGITAGILLTQSDFENTQTASIRNNVFNSQANDDISGAIAITVDNQSRGNISVSLVGNRITMPEGFFNVAGINIIADAPGMGSPGITSASLHRNISLTPASVPGYLFENSTISPEALQIHFGEDNIGTREHIP